MQLNRSDDPFEQDAQTPADGDTGENKITTGDSGTNPFDTGNQEPEINPEMPEVQIMDGDQVILTEEEIKAAAAAQAQQEPEEPDIGFKPQFESYDPVNAKQYFYDGDAAAQAQRDQVDETYRHIDEQFNASNKKLKIALYASIGAAALILIIIAICLGVYNHQKNKPPEPVEEPPVAFEIKKPDAVGMKKSSESQEIIDPGELSVTLSNPVYEPEAPAYLSYVASIPDALQLYYGIGKFTDLNAFQAMASSYAAFIRANLMEPLNLFHDIRYTDYKSQNHPEPEYIGTNYAILSGTDFYLTHNYELMLDSDGCQVATYSYTFNLKNTARIEEYDFTEYLDCLRVLTGFDLSNNDMLYLLRVSMNNYNQHGESSVQIISQANPEDYILFEQVAGTDLGSYNFLITASKSLGNINAPNRQIDANEQASVNPVADPLTPEQIQALQNAEAQAQAAAQAEGQENPAESQAQDGQQAPEAQVNPSAAN